MSCKCYYLSVMIISDITFTVKSEDLCVNNYVRENNVCDIKARE